MKPAGRRRWRMPLYAGMTVLALVALPLLTGVFRSSGEGEAEQALSPEEKLVRDAARAFDPTQSTLRRLGSVSRTMNSLKGIPRSRREEMVAAAMLAGVNGNLDAFRKLPEAEKAERAELLYRDAVRTRNFFRGLSASKRRRAKELLYSDPGGKAETDRIMNTILNALTPEDRKMLNPVFMVWKNALEEM